MVCQPHQYILMKMASYMPQGYNMQASYTAQQQKGLVYTAPRMGDYVALSGYNSQKGYLGVGQSTILQGYNTKRTRNYGESGYLFLKTPEVMGAVGGESFKTRRLNDLLGEEVEKAVFTLPQTERKSSIQSSYERRMVYKPQKREEQKNVEEDVDTSVRDRGVKDKDIDTKRLAELIEQELRQFQAVNQQMHHV